MSDLKGDSLAIAFSQRFKVEIETAWNIFSNSLVSSRRDGQDFTPEQKAWLDGWNDRGLA